MKVSLSAYEIRLVKVGLEMLRIRLLYEAKEKRGEEYSLADYSQELDFAANAHLPSPRPQPLEIELLLRYL